MQANQQQHKFVFVVCGSAEHIHTLHFSIRYLSRFSKNEIIVVTDPKRNEIPVAYHNVLEVDTPAHFTHHQASIYLKVGLHKFLHPGPLYCYLDTDVIALSAACDDIFFEKRGPVTFAADHCILPKFSPSAVRCNCLDKNKADIAELEQLMERFDPGRKEKDPEMEHKKQRLIKKFELIKRNRFNYFLISVRFLTTLHTFKLDNDTFYNRWKKVWHDKHGRIIIRPAESMFRDIEKNSQWRWNKIKRRWYGPDGRDVYDLQCYHLVDYINQRFGVHIANPDFQHWNGGVFLFDDSSREFMDTWFEKTMQAFTFPDWYTRDQGTLIATVWKLGLQNNPLLPRRFNFIADYHNTQLMMDDEGNFSDDAFRTKVKPALIHIYHNFGMKGWDIWDYVEQIGKENSILDERNN